MQPLELPDFDFADDPTVERFLPSFDGRWSQQTKAIQKALGIQRLELNGNWAGVPTDWCCPVCRRYKPEIARLTPAGVVLCQLDRHHDHLADEGARILWRGQQKQPDRARQDALHSAIQVCMALGERFHQTLVCSDCNAADGAAKSALAGTVHPEFSFAPSEIARFIRVAPNRSHEVDIEAARAVWLEVADDVRDRLSFMEVMARRVAEGRHSREGSGYAPHHKATLLTDVLSATGHPRMQVEWLAGAVEKRSIQRDGFASSVKKPSKKSVVAGAGEIPAVLASAYREAARSDGGAAAWLEPIRDRQLKIRRAFVAEALRLARSGRADDQAVGRRIEQFVRDMPPVETREQQIQRQLEQARLGKELARPPTEPPDRSAGRQR